MLRHRGNKGGYEGIVMTSKSGTSVTRTTCEFVGGWYHAAIRVWCVCKQYQSFIVIPVRIKAEFKNQSLLFTLALISPTFSCNNFQ